MINLQNKINRKRNQQTYVYILGR